LVSNKPIDSNTYSYGTWQFNHQALSFFGK
jgi:hypothetical protein